jgi:hypothetical protein
VKWICPYCQHITTTDDDAAGVRHGCAARGGDLADMRPSSEEADSYLLYCAGCRRQASVAAADIPDGAEWLCSSCQASAA